MKMFVRLLYHKFNYFLLIVLGLSLLFNGFNPIPQWLAVTLMILFIISSLTIYLIVNFNEEEMIVAVLLSRFVKFDILIISILIIIYIGICNNYFYSVF